MGRRSECPFCAGEKQHIYIALCPDAGAFKLGWTSNFPVHRMTRLEWESGLFHQLVVYWCIPARARAIEREVHAWLTGAEFGYEVMSVARSREYYEVPVEDPLYFEEDVQTLLEALCWPERGGGFVPPVSVQYG